VSETSSPRSVAREVLRLTGPAVMTGLLQTVVFLADRVMLGRYGEDALASMQISGPVLWSVFSVFFGSMVGAVAMIARNVGAGEHERASQIARTLLRFAGLLGCGVALLGVAGSGAIAAWMAPADRPAIDALAHEYMAIFFMGFPLVYLGAAAALVANAGGDTRITMRVGIISNLVNVAINYVLIYGHTLGPLDIPALGAGGAAIGSVVAYGVETTLLLRALRRPPSERRGFFATTSPIVLERVFATRVDADEHATRRAIVRLSAPALAERLVIHGGYIAYAKIITGLGGTAMAANQALITLESICFLAADGFGVAAATVVGTYLGRKQPGASRLGGWLATGSCAAVLGLLGLVIWASAPWTAWLFVPPELGGGEAMVAMVLATMPMLVLSQPVMAAAVVLGHGLRGAGDTRSPLLASVLGGLVLRVALALIMTEALGLGLLGIWITTCSDWTLRTIILVAIFARGRWQSLEVDATRADH
jgi:putative MATE family efflux protein